MNTTTMLVVDDQKSVRSYLRITLEGLGYSVLEAADGREGLELYEQYRPNLVLTDLEMPEMDGLTLIAALNKRYTNVPIIVISGKSTLCDAVEAVHRGAWDYLVKPLKDDGTLEIALNRALEQSRLLTENQRYREELEQQVEAKTHQLRESNERYQRLLESVTNYVYTVRLIEGRVSETVHGLGCETVTGFTADEFAADPLLWYRIIHEDDRALVIGVTNHILAKPVESVIEYRIIHKNGSIRWVRNTFVPSLDLEGALHSYDCIIADITDRKQAEQRIKRHIEKLAALRTIDQAISGSLDLHTILTIFLHETLKQLSIDAACVLLLNPYSQELEYALGLGFETDYISSSQVHMGESFAGQVARERKTRVVNNISSSDTIKVRQGLLEHEGFKACVGVPLVAKGQAKGVLELFHRAPLHPDREWLDFVEALAGQAAIALDNADLFDGLQRSHSDLLQAYDTTIEGWSRALDFRDQETEGHSRRVTILTVRIARELGMNKEKLVHVRRGALLHDIGKLGVPDSILLKPGALSDAEFAIMKKHPEIAHSIISPIEFLHPALDIPYCHHEKWDGSGYPRGLKGSEIPLTARIFAIVDVWDALRSNRPYRTAWTEAKTREYIASQSGKHFDPKIVKLFEQILIGAPTISLKTRAL